jgi:hypothetical protein
MADNTFWRSPDLGTPRDLDVPGGKLRALEAGDPSNSTIVFVHGLLVNANLAWTCRSARTSWRSRMPTCPPPGSPT